MYEVDITRDAAAISARLITLRRFVAIEILLTVVFVALSFVDEALLPSPLREFQRQAAATFGPEDIILLVLCVPFLILMIIAWVALWRGWRSGRIIYTIVWICSVPIALLSGPTVQTAIHSVVETTGIVVSGIIFGLLYFSEIRHLYAPSQRT